MRTSFIKIIIILLVVGLQADLYSQVEKSGKIFVEITNIRNENGNVKLSLFDVPDAFPGDHEQALGRIITDISGTTTTAVFEDIPYGEYAVAIMHDENNNLIMDTNWIGIPKEGVGASNDAPAKMGPPKYKDAKFDLNKPELRLKIKMAYF